MPKMGIRRTFLTTFHEERNLRYPHFEKDYFEAL
jgi:hypothetical protein